MRLFREELGVDIYAHGGEVTFTGDPDKVALARLTLEKLLEIVQRGDQLILYSAIVGPKQLGEVMEKFPHRVLYNALGRPYFCLRVQKGESPLVLLRDVVTLLPGAQNQPQTKP